MSGTIRNGGVRWSAARGGLLLALLASTCGGEGIPMVTRGAIPDPTALEARKVLFGHQSVGASLLAGIGALWPDRAGAGLRIVDLDPAGIEGPALFHFRVGRNGDPRSKIESFERTLGSLAAAPPDLAGFKFCYADFGPSTDVETVFRAYRETLDRLGREFPSVRFFHVTVPVERNEAFWKVLAKKAVGRPTARDANRARGRYNRLLVEAYPGAVFDLAAAEADETEGPEAHSLAPRFTDDGEHLNAAGQRVVGGRFVEFLVGFAEAGSEQR